MKSRTKRRSKRTDPLSRKRPRLAQYPDLTSSNFPTDDDIKFLSSSGRPTPWSYYGYGTHWNRPWPQRQKAEIVDKSGTSSIGILDILPLELLHMILKEIDLKSLSSFAETSYRGWIATNSLPWYEELFDKAYSVMVVLGRSGLAKRVAFGTLYDALRSEACVGCPARGAFLFLPPCVRSCGNCLRNNQALGLMSLDVLSRIYRLSSAEMKELPTMVPLLDATLCQAQNDHPLKNNQVAIRSLIPFALKKYGSQKRLAEVMLTARGYYSRYYNYGDLASEQCLDRCNDRESAVTEDFTTKDPEIKMLGLEFPFLNRDATPPVQKALACAGCGFIAAQLSLGRLNAFYSASKASPVNSVTVPAWAIRTRYDPMYWQQTPSHRRTLYSTLRNLQAERYLKDDFVQHIKTCQFVRDFIFLKYVRKRYD